MKTYPPGTRIAGQYEVAGRPLVGGMGIVYLCFDHEEQRPVALKTFKPKYLPDRAARDRFLREGTTWISLGRHPHIVSAYEVERVADEQGIYLVLELVTKDDGCANASLRSWLMAGKPLSLEQALLFGLQIARGMAHAVTTVVGLVHRDLKPENVLVGKDRLPDVGVNRLRVTDFGLVSVLQETGQKARGLGEGAWGTGGNLGRTQLTRGVVGTPLYMAPEQWRGEEVTIQTDIYALGCILYEMLTGQHLVDGDSLEALEHAHCVGELQPLLDCLPASVRELVGGCLAKEPGARYGDWEEAEEALSTVYTKATGQAAPALPQAAALERVERVAVGWSYNSIGQAYQDIGKVDVALRYFEMALSIGQEEGETRLVIAGLGNLGTAHHLLGQKRHAIDYYERALSIAQQVGGRDLEATGLSNLGAAYKDLGEVRRAIEYQERALAIYREVKDRHGEAVALGNLGISCKELGDARGSIEYFEQALAIYQKIGDQRGIGSVLGSLGETHRRLGDAQRSIGYFEQVLAIARATGDRRGEGNVLGNLGETYRLLGDIQQSIKFLRQALMIHREIGNRDSEGTALGTLGSTYLLQGDIQRSMACYEQRLEIAREIGDRRGEGIALGNLGNIYLETGEVRRALGLFEQALALAQEIGDRLNEGRWLASLGRVHDDLEDTKRAIEFYRQALAVQREIGDRHGEGGALCNLGLIYKKLEDTHRAIECLAQAKRIMAETGDMRGTAMAEFNLATALAMQGRVAEALAHATRAAQLFASLGFSQYAQQAQQLIALIQDLR